MKFFKESTLQLLTAMEMSEKKVEKKIFYSQELLDLSARGVDKESMLLEGDDDEVMDDEELIAMLSSRNEYVFVEPTTDGDNDDEDLYKGLPSLGSIAHASGNCNPCSYFPKAGGCKQGRNCTFCHSCTAISSSRRQQKKLKKAKEWDRKLKEQQERLDEVFRMTSQSSLCSTASDLSPSTASTFRRSDNSSNNSTHNFFPVAKIVDGVQQRVEDGSIEKKAAA